MQETKTMREYEQAKHKLSRIALFKNFYGIEMFTTEEFRRAFEEQESIFRIYVRTPPGPTRGGHHDFLRWSDRIRRLLDHYCDHLGRGKWRVNLTKKAWNLKEGGNENGQPKNH
jgi:hypothetical protein